ncbi:ankyrin repeat-containing domain protein [Ilyonectria robusta]|uniref:ankyrin repeat-containing domain protein n=1 Tax=Ilyonectria robusta TaxID=1079257 RepID=UPI001E8E8974|nr:ankyrin repeat-containing domain protein [Ilyonectria robusta]KAH8684931.1 ankyrin repeat-containing domain protein [Ilyonectria robusta]
MGYETIVNLLLDTDKADANAEDKDGRTPLLYAAGSGCETIVNRLLNTGKAEINIKDKNGRTPLSYAAENSHKAVVNLLLDTGKAEIDAKDREALSMHSSRNTGFGNYQPFDFADLDAAFLKTESSKLKVD